MEHTKLDYVLLTSPVGRSHMITRSGRNDTSQENSVNLMAMASEDSENDFQRGLENGQSPWADDEGPEPSYTDNPLMQVRSASPEMQHQRLPLPVWMRESSKSFRWKWVPLPIRNAGRSVASWSKGPDPPQIQKITPIFPSIQEAPIRLVDRYLPNRKQKAALLAFFFFTWILTFSLILHHSATSGNIEGYGTPQNIWCGASYWAGGNGCGLDGNSCRPFDNATFAFRCPANCARTIVFNPRAVGDQEIEYQSFVIGGRMDDGPGLPASEPIYRGDSFICQAAIHAGVVSNEKGGCGVVALAGKHDKFPSATGHGITSIGFDSSFPKSFTFTSGLSSHCGAVDLRWPLLAVTVIFTALLSLFCSSPAVFFASVFPMLFIHVSLVSDPPNLYGYPSLSSLAIGRFLPAAFVGYVIYRYCVKHQLSGLTAQIEKTILWLGGAWIGSLNNYTFDFIPIQRLTPHDLSAQPGARLALVIIVLSIFAIALGQIYYLRLEGRFPRYLALYAMMGGFLIICVVIPQLSLRIHHYVLALLLLPGTGIQTRPSLLYQGILVGLFINGTARWGFDSIMQTAESLRGGDSQLDSLLPNITAPIISAANITFAWAFPPEGYDGLSILVNDVERHRWYGGEGDSQFTWDREQNQKEYFRFGYMIGSDAADYTKAGVWEEDGSWRSMKPGPSR